MAAERFFIERRHGPMNYVPVGTQPAMGFASVDDAVDWLLARGWVQRRLTANGEPFLEGWGGERGFYVRAVPRVHVLEEPLAAALPMPMGLYQWPTAYGQLTRESGDVFSLSANVRAALRFIKRRRGL